MFTDANKHPVPVGHKRLPCRTEHVNSKREGGESTHSPVTWMDPLVPITLTIGGVTVYGKTSQFPYTHVLVDCDERTPLEHVPLSEYGRQLIVSIEADFAQSGAVRSLLPSKGVKDRQSVASLLHMTRLSPWVQMADEAMFVRLMMMAMCWQESEWYAFNTSVLSDLAINGRYKKGSAKRIVTDAITSGSDTPEEGQIPGVDGSSYLFVRPLSTVVNMLAANSSDTDIKVGDVRIAPGEIEFIPVQQSWEGQPWLLPYILAHTTTLWWNHAVRISMDQDILGRADTVERE